MGSLFLGWNKAIDVWLSFNANVLAALQTLYALELTASCGTDARPGAAKTVKHLLLEVEVAAR